MAINGNRSGSFERIAVALVCLAILGSGAGVAIATVVARLLDYETLAPGVAGTLVGIAACCALTRRAANRLPRELDGWFGRRRVLSIMWCLAAALSVINTARLGLFVADPSQRWASAFPPVEGLARHQCLAAFKLSMMGVDTGRGLASILAWAWTVLAVTLAVLALVALWPWRR